jgi:PAS domain S-box-containing protein
MTRKDGSRFYGEVRASLLRDQAGRPTVLATQMRDITERKNAEDALRESEERMRRLASATFEGVVFSEAGIILEGNEQLARIYGRELSEMIGRPVLEFVATEWKDQVREKIQAGFEGTYEYVALRKDGSRITVEVQSRMLVHKGRPVRVSAIRDITERKRSEAITRQRLTLMEYAEGHSLPDLLQKMVDELCNLTESPIGFFHLVGEDQKSIGLQTWSSRTVAEFCDLAHLEQHYPIDRAGAWADAVRQRKPLIHNNYAALTGRQGQPDGHLMLVREMVIPVVRGEKVVALVGVGNKPHDYAEQDMEVSSRFADYAWDITERTQMEKSLEEERNSLARRVEERTSQLSFVNAELTRASRMKDEFLSTMSHELRTPLNAILSLSESLEEETYGPLTADQASSLKIISESGYHLLGLINDILDVSKIEAGKLGLEIAPVDIDMACHAALRLVRQQAAQKRLKVSYSREADVIGLAADDRRLKQMLVNLLSNAVKFTPEGGEIGLLVSSEAEGEIIRFTVWDTGLGIPHEKLDRLFQPFVQLDSSLSRSHAGTGLGLALVRKLAELHGGGAGVQTEPGHGSRFYFALPAGLDKGDGSAMLAARDPRHAQDDGSLSLPDNEQLGPRLKDFDAQGVCVLVAEDNPVSLTIIRDYLVAHAFRVVAAGNGVEALDRAAEFGPDLILMDIQMPEMDGLEACRRLRAIPRFASVPIVAMTALAMPGDRERCLGAGATDYITKPLSLRALLGTARGLLGSIEAVGGDQNGA